MTPDSAEDLGQRVLNHVAAVRRHIPSLHQANALIAIEDNLMWVAPRVCRIVTERAQRPHGSITIYYDKPGEPGFKTNYSNKHDRMSILSAVLSECKLVFHRSFFVPQPNPRYNGLHPKLAIVDQMRDYKLHFGKPKRRSDGTMTNSQNRYGPSSEGRRDDYVDAISMGIYYLAKQEELAARIFE